ncbi:MAG TPA: MlaD family protein [Marmoricola sp.]|nr:MlaD family protein [Marmoricola sp.]
MTFALRARLAVFGLLAVISVVFAGVNYVGIPERYLGDSYRVSVNLPDSGGIFTNAEVTLRGIQIGRVGSLHLTPDGVRVDLQIRRGTRIPTDTKVVVGNLSAVGEQYVELQPARSSGPFLTPGAALPVSAATTPPQVTALLVNLDRLARSLGKAQLRTVVSELGNAFDGSAQDLATVLRQAQAVTRDLSAAQPRLNGLLSDGRTVLGTQRDLDSRLQQLTRGLDTVTRTLAAEDPALRSILDQAPTTLDNVRDLLAHNQPAVGVLLGNLLTVSDIVADPIRLRSLNTELVLLPRVIQGTFNIQPGDGYARLGAVIDTSQRVCTRGYESSGQPPLQSTDVSPVPGNPSLRANVNAYCAMPPSSGVDVRGAANVPRPAGDDTNRVIPTTNPRGFGPGSTFRNEAEPGAANSTDAAAPPADARVRTVAPTDLRGLLMRGLDR